MISWSMTAMATEQSSDLRNGVDPAVGVHDVLCQRLDEIERVVVVGIGDGVVPEEILLFGAGRRNVSDNPGGD